MDALPALAQMNKEGDSGRKKMTMVLRMLALILSAVQGYGIIVTLINSEAITLGDDSLGVIQKLLYL